MKSLFALTLEEWFKIALADQYEENISKMNVYHGWGLNVDSPTLIKAVEKFHAAVNKLQSEIYKSKLRVFSSEFKPLIKDLANYALRFNGVDFLLFVIHFFVPHEHIFDMEKAKKHLLNYIDGAFNERLEWFKELHPETIFNMTEIIFHIYKYLIQANSERPESLSEITRIRNAYLIFLRSSAENGCYLAIKNLARIYESGISIEIHAYSFPKSKAESILVVRPGVREFKIFYDAVISGESKLCH